MEANALTGSDFPHGETTAYLFPLCRWVSPQTVLILAIGKGGWAGSVAVVTSGNHRRVPNMVRNCMVSMGIVLVLMGLAACQTTNPQAAALAPDMRKWTAERGQTSCTSLQPKYRIAAGVKASLGLPQYRAAVLAEMSGAGQPVMNYKEALALSTNTAKVLQAEIRRRCPKQRVRGKEEIVYVPQ